MSDRAPKSTISTVQHFVPRGLGNIYVRDYPGSDPAFVLMHGFPDNLGIYDDLLPYLVASGRRVVTFDFLGFGRSDKPADAIASFAGQLGDLGAVVDALGLEKIIPVAHDSSGPAAINYTLENPGRVAELVILNSGYDDAIPIPWSEIVTLYATRSLGALAGAIAQSPAQFGWLLAWQKTRFIEPLPADQQERFERSIAPLIAGNFMSQPSSVRAFMQLTADFFPELARNSKRLSSLGNLDTRVRVIWGELDPNLTADVGRDRASRFRNASFRLLEAGHWVQADLPALVAAEMLTTLA